LCRAIPSINNMTLRKWQVELGCAVNVIVVPAGGVECCDDLNRHEVIIEDGGKV
jgi:hypothetical protein